MKHLSLFYLCISVCVGGGGGILYEGELNHNKNKFLCIFFASWSCVTKFIKIQTVKAATMLSETKNNFNNY